MTNNPYTDKLLSPDFAKQYPLHILVAEDNPINQQLTLHILQMLGYNAALADDGKKAVEMTCNQPFDIILMDVQMPEMDGLEATKLIRQKKEKQPVILAMTANAMQGDEEECLLAGMNDYLSKPVKLEDLVSMLRKWASDSLVN